MRYAVLLRSTSENALDSAVERNYTLLDEAQGNPLTTVISEFFSPEPYRSHTKAEDVTMKTFPPGAQQRAILIVSLIILLVLSFGALTLKTGTPCRS